MTSLRNFDSKVIRCRNIFIFVNKSMLESIVLFHHCYDFLISELVCRFLKFWKYFKHCYSTKTNIYIRSLIFDGKSSFFIFNQFLNNQIVNCRICCSIFRGCYWILKLKRFSKSILLLSNFGNCDRRSSSWSWYDININNPPPLS